MSLTPIANTDYLFYFSSMIQEVPIDAIVTLAYRKELIQVLKVILAKRDWLFPEELGLLSIVGLSNKGIRYRLKSRFKIHTITWAQYLAGKTLYFDPRN
jgi:hypothetical protein